MTKRPIFQRHEDSNFIADRLAKTSPGEVVTYDELSVLISKDVRKEGYTYLYTAKKILAHDGIFFSPIRNVGLQRLNDNETVTVAEQRLARTKRITRNVQEMLSSVNYDQLDAASKVTHNTAMSVAGVVRHVMAKPQMQKIRSHVQQSQAVLPNIAVLALFFKK